MEYRRVGQEFSCFVSGLVRALDKVNAAIRWRRACIVLLCGLVVARAVTAPAHGGESRGAKVAPNILLLLADDLGYGDVGFNGGTEIRTPAIDRLAAEGQRWTSFYAAGCVCVPSRMGLMTGKYPMRIHGEVRTPALLPAEEFTLAEMLKQAGYRTALIGKWHLGMDGGSHPLDQGFHEFFGTPSSNDHFGRAGRPHSYENFRDATSADYAVPLIRGREIIERPVNQPSLTKRYTEQAVKWVREHKTAPFFLCLAYNMPHVPVFASEAFAGKSRRGKYGDAVEELDWSVGEVLRTLESEGLTRNTLVVFLSDNGPWRIYRELGGTAAPYRNGKGTCWEGGFRVPFVARWPERIAPGTTHELGTGLDLFATVASIVGLVPPAGAAVDSLDLSRVLLEAAPSPRSMWVYQHEEGEVWAVRVGRFKAHFRSAAAHRAPAEQHSPPLLFDLEQDPGETTDRANAYPDQVREIEARLEQFRRGLPARRAARQSG